MLGNFASASWNADFARCAHESDGWLAELKEVLQAEARISGLKGCSRGEPRSASHGRAGE
jgi:hypothetical protein